VNDLNLNEEKNDLLGELDCLNSFIGLAKSLIKNKAIKSLLTAVQNDLFVIQVNVARSKSSSDFSGGIMQDRILSIQKETSLIERGLPKIKHFIIPEGDTGACMLHYARTIARQVEKKIPGYLHKPTNIATYLDRVACLMFALARKITQDGGHKERPPDYAQSKLRITQPQFRNSEHPRKEVAQWTGK